MRSILELRRNELHKDALEKNKNSTEQKNNVFIIEFYWNIIGIQNSTKNVKCHHYFTIKWNFPIIWNFEEILMEVFGGNLREFWNSYQLTGLFLTCLGLSGIFSEPITTKFCTAIGHQSVSLNMKSC